MLPRARIEGMVVEELSGETLVYDRSRKTAHCLNPTAALVWRNCDGKTSLADIAGRLRGELDAPADEELVSLALARLAEAKLLDERPPATGFTRRQLAGRLGLVGALSLLLPVVTTINAPAAAQAGSNGIPGGCGGVGAQCIVNVTAPCCQGLICNGEGNTCVELPS